jgi:tetratricopeptide (TPR) repeat protein
MNKKLKQFLFLAASITCGFILVFALSGFLEKNRPPLPENYADEDLTLQGAKIKGFALGFEGLLADWYWMKSLQYVGDKVLNSKEEFSLDNLNPLNPRLLYPYLNNATDLDPKFISVYEYGATVLPAIDKEQAIKLTQKGIDNNPENWRLYQYLGYIYWRLKNYEKASETYAKGSQIAGSPEFMKSMAARMKSEGGNREIARIIYQQMFDEAQDAQSKENASLRLLQLRSLDERDTIQKVLNNFKLKNNRCSNNWRELFPYYKILPDAEGERLKFDANLSPVDPKGFAYKLDTENCQPNLAFDSTIPSK